MQQIFTYSNKFMKLFEKKYKSFPNTISKRNFHFTYEKKTEKPFLDFLDLATR
jgi:hypothetical protein